MQMRRPVMRTAMIVAVLSLMLSSASSAQAWPASHITASLPAGAPEEAKKDIEAASAQVDDVERVSGAWASASDIPAQTAEADHRLMTPSLAEADTLPTGFRINEVVFHPESGAHQWVELTNEGPSIIDVGGYALTDEDGNWYVFPEDTPSVPVGAFVVVLYDGLGAAYNDLGFDDDVMVLHTQPGLVSVFEGEADQVALYTGTKLQPIYLPLVVKNVNTSASVSGGVVTSGAASRTEDVAEPTLISYVAWGADPGTDTGDAAAMGLWSTGAYVPVSVGESQATILPGESIGLLPGSACAYEHSWTLYPMGEVTFGDSNPPPAINSYHPNAGDTLDSETFAVAWNLIHNAVGYRFQLDDGPDFMSPYTDTVLGGPAYVAPSPIPEGTYYWRVKTILQEGESAWSPGVLVRSLEYPGDTVTAQAAQIGVLGIEWQLQRKDTNMLCLYGCPEAGDARWDAPHPESGGVKPHGVNYCSRAALSMFVSYYGAKLSQDRIAHYDYKDTTSHILDTYNTLGHGRPNRLPMSSLISWTGIPYSQVWSPTYEQIKGWIGEQRPMIAWVTRYGRDNKFGYHFVVVDGYREWSDGESTYEQIHVLDPWDSDRWPLFDEYSGNINALYVGPDYCPLEIREDSDDEYRISEDADGDGICDFDEVYRFYTDPNDSDSDGDGVPDKADLREYVFSPTHGGWGLRWADWDGDGIRKELDPDNDGGGSSDGCEDTNGNGVYEPSRGETSNFDSSQEKPCEAKWEIVAPDGTQPNGLTWDGSHLWMSSYIIIPGIYEIDPIDGSVMGMWIPPVASQKFYGGLTFDGTHLWLAHAYGDVIYRLGTDDCSVVSSIPTVDDELGDLAWDGQYLWACGYPSQKLYRIDPGDGSVVAEFDVPQGTGQAQTAGLAYDGSHLWLSGLSDIYKIDPTNGQLVATIQTTISRPDSLAWDGEYLWAASFDEARIYRIDVERP